MENLYYEQLLKFQVELRAIEGKLKVVEEPMGGRKGGNSGEKSKCPSHHRARVDKGRASRLLG